MKKILKLLLLIVVCSSVFYIYQKTKNDTYNLINIGDELSISINSYGIKDYSPVSYYKNELLKTHKTVNINNEYSEYENSIRIMLEKLKNNNSIRKDLMNSDQIIITLGYNDLIYKLNVSDELNPSKFYKIITEIEKDYNSLIEEIRKYTPNKIIVILYPDTYKEDYYLKKGIVYLNELLKKNKEVTYIDTYDLLNNRQKYFSNPYSFYPNREGYRVISREIIRKTLEK